MMKSTNHSKKILSKVIRLMLLSMGLFFTISATAQIDFRVKNATDCPVDIVVLLYDQNTNALITPPGMPTTINPQSSFYAGCPTNYKVCLVAGDMAADGDFEIKMSSITPSIPAIYAQCHVASQTLPDQCYNGAQLDVSGSEIRWQYGS